MTLSALYGVSFIFPRIFLRICRWVLVRMSLNFKLKKSKVPMNGSNRVWRRRVQLLFLGLLCIVFGVVGFLMCMNIGVFWRDETSLCPHKDELLLEHFNVSKDQLHALASNQVSSLQFTKRLGHHRVCTLKVVCSNEDLQDLHSLVVKNVDFQYQCPLQDDNIPTMLSLPFLENESPTSPSRSLSSSISMPHENFEENISETSSKHCESSLLCLVKACGWISVGLVLNCIVSSLYEKAWSYQPQTRSSIKSTGNWRKKFLVVLLIVGIVGPFCVYRLFSNNIKLKRKETLTNMCDQRARMLQDQFNVSMNHVHALAILVSTFHHGKQPSAIDQKTFEEYTERTSFERPLTSGVAYALRVLHSERDQFEEQHGWTIKKMETEDQTLVQDCSPENLDPSPPEDEYAPVIFSQKTVSHIVSIDMMSGKEDRENILRARASGKGVLTSPFKLLKSNHLGVVLTFAVYDSHLPPDATPEQRINATVGYLGASYDVPSLVDKLLHQLASEQTVVVNVYDTTDKTAPINMYGTDVIDRGLLHISNLDFGDPARKHEMHCRFSETPPPPWTAIGSSLAFFVITFLVFALFRQAENRITEVERDFHEMMLLKHRAEAADVAKSQFLATVSHEIRTPMNGVLGMLQMLMDTDLSANQLDYAQTAHASGEDLISLINEVLDQAKIESGRLELETVPFDLRSVLDNVLSLFSGKSHEKGIELAVYVSDQVPPAVIGDPGRFRQIINNLVGNSIKFIQGKGHIFVSVHVADEVRNPHDVMDQVLRQSIASSHEYPHNSNNTFSGFTVVERWKSWEKFKNLTSDTEFINDTGKIKLLVTVEDTGEGITQEAQGRIFTPFMQADSSTSRTHGGTGIGLSISKRLVELMGGEIGFVSEPGTGSTFSFTAVFTKGEKDCLDTSTTRPPYDSSVEKLRGLRALVVDDKSIRAEVTKYHLQRLGISADVASSLDSACACLSNVSSSSVLSPYSMVLADKVLWDTDASLSFRHLLKELRRNGTTHIPESLVKVFLLATSLSQTERNELKSAGLVDDVLMKPLRLSVLVSCFQDVLGIVRRRQLNQDRPSHNGILRNKRILVVDDHVVNRRVAEATLKKLGANVTCVDSGKASLPMLKPPHSFDACFMDLQMPEMDGFEATRRIRAMELEVNERIKSGEESAEMYASVAHWHVPILAMTADVIQAKTEERVNCGMDDYVTKPIEEKKLYAAIARFFGPDMENGRVE